MLGQRVCICEILLGEKSIINGSVVFVHFQIS